MSRYRGSSNIDDFGGVNKAAPVMAGFFTVAALSSLALPGLISFIGEFLVLIGAFERYMWVGAIATLGIVITAAYVLRVYQKTMTGPLKPELAGIKDLTGREIAAMAPIVAMVIFLGFFPSPLLKVINPAVDRTMVATGSTTPAPVLAPAEGSTP
jgi:NADH-quinone oxidoreductase subunit M